MRHVAPDIPPHPFKLYVRGRRRLHRPADPGLQPAAVPQWYGLSSPFLPCPLHCAKLHFSVSVGVFFLFGAGRLALCRSQPQQAIEYYTRAMEVQTQYRNLHHVSFWEIAVAKLALWDLRGSWECWGVLEKEATVYNITLSS